MKKIIYTLIISTACFLWGCEKESNESFIETQLQVQVSNATFTAAGGTGSIVVADSGLPVSAVSNENWCTATVSGNTVTITVGSNLDFLGRTAMITLKSGKKVNYVSVSQAPVYLELDNYDAVSFLGNGGEISIPYTCSVDVPLQVIPEASWLSAVVSDGMIHLTAGVNSNFLSSRSTKIKVIAGDDLVTMSLNVEQAESMSSYEPDPELETIKDFLDLKNVSGTYSSYRITLYSPRLATLYNNLKAAYPEFQEIRIQAPRGTYKLSVILYNNDGTASYYYWNATDGLVPIDESKSVGMFAISGNSYAGTTARYTGNTNYTQLRTFFTSSAGFTIFPDLEESTTYWFRSVADPKDYFKLEPS